MSLENTYSFFHMEKIQYFLEKSPIKMKKYLCLVVEVIDKDPQTSKWILSNTACALLS